MRRPPALWTLLFVLATLVCAAAAAVAGASPVGASIHPQRGDVVVFVVPRAAPSCNAGEVATGRVLGLHRDALRIGRKQVRVGGQLRPKLLLNGAFLSVVPKLGAQSFPPIRVPSGDVFLLGTAHSQRCDSRVLGPVRLTNVVGYTQGSVDARVGVVGQELRDRVTAEKYVAGVYLLVVAFFLLYLLIHAGRLGRLESSAAELLGSPPAKSPGPRVEVVRKQD